jgi:hypothetical protein
LDGGREKERQIKAHKKAMRTRRRRKLRGEQERRERGRIKNAYLTQ